MSLFRRRKLLRRFFHALEKVAGNLGLIREAGKEMRTFSHEEVTLVRQLSESRQRMLDLQAMRAEQARQAQSAVARQVLEAIDDVERRQQALLARQSVLLALCRQLLLDRNGGGATGSNSGAMEAGSTAASVGEPPGAVASPSSSAVHPQVHQPEQWPWSPQQAVAWSASSAAEQQQPEAPATPGWERATTAAAAAVPPQPPQQMFQQHGMRTASASSIRSHPSVAVAKPGRIPGSD